MKKLAVSILWGLFVYAVASAAGPDPEGLRDLKHYRGASPDEAEILKRALDYQKACNLYDPRKVLAVYSQGALIKARLKENGAERMVTKEAYAAILADKLSKWKLYAFRIKLFAPQKMKVAADRAELQVPFIVYSISQDYWEKGVYNFDFKRADSKWLISRSTWEILDLFYNP